MPSLHSDNRILAIEISLDLIASFSLKDKRRLRQRLIDRLRRSYNLSIIESGRQEDYRSLDLAAAYVAIDEHTAEIMAERIKESVFNLTEGEAELTLFYTELLS